MTQEATQLRTDPPYPGLAMVQDINKLAQTLGTDFAGATDPAATAWAYAVWADTGTLTIKRRNAANSAWVIEGRLLRAHMPIIPFAEIPLTNIGQISVETVGIMEWDGAAYKAIGAAVSDLQWVGTPIGNHVECYTPPPTNNPRFRYILCTAGQAGSGGYNEGVLTSESVSGVSPNIVAEATISLVGSPMNGTVTRLINTTREFLRPGVPSDIPQSGQNEAHEHIEYNPAGATGTLDAFSGGTPSNGSTKRSMGNTGIQGGDEARPRNYPATYYQRIL